MNPSFDLRKSVRSILKLPLVWRANRREKLYATKARHEIAVCAIFREEALFLEEWLSFHVGVGVSHFYLYNNFSTDHYKDVLAPWIERRVVTLKDWPVPVGQVSAYRDCFRQVWRDCRWLLFIDIDEFLFSPNCVDIRSILSQYTDLPGIEIWQAFYGANGHERRPKLPVTEAYLSRASLAQTTVKTIANPRRLYKAGVHQSKYYSGEALDPSRRKVEKGVPPVLDTLRINHYWSRSLEDLQDKIARGDASTSNRRDHDWHMNFERQLNEERDESILPIARAILNKNAGDQ